MKKAISMPIVVEGKYDKITLTSLFDCTVLTTDGFGIFNSREKRALITRLGKNGLIILTDSDGGGRQIRSFLSSVLPKDRLHNVYIPKIEGKERRKTHAGKAGILGVEGMPREVLERLLSPFFTDRKLDTGVTQPITKLDFFELGLSGGESSSEKRKLVCSLADLPDDMTANALIEAVNLLYTREDFLDLVRRALA